MDHDAPATLTARAPDPTMTQTQSTNRNAWHLVTGEYPPQPGGVADYTALLGAELAKSGDDVHVWTSSGPDDPNVEIPGVTVHRSAGRWSGDDLARLDREFEAIPGSKQIVVQYAPNAWGFKGMNLGFCRWLVRRKKRGDDVRVMFHECWYTLERRDKPMRYVLVAVQRLMARALMNASSQVYMSIPYWESMLRRSEPPGKKRSITWTPVPSNVPYTQNPEAVAALRKRWSPDGRPILASFGTFGETIGSMMGRIVPGLVTPDNGRVFVLIGRGSDRFASRLIAENPHLEGRLISTGGLAPDDLSAHLQACDLLIQPYPDGVSSRRGSLMAGLANGVPAVTNLGARSEPVWSQSPCIILAPVPDPDAVIAAAGSALANPEGLAALRPQARAFYEQHFEIRRTVEAIRGLAVDAPRRP